ncbi:MAG: fructose-bisphosphate aldolase [Patescibacteria group bacterium]|nr:fructose-bisphosphate aldolase [Patescibacteria group bacterium]
MDIDATVAALMAERKGILFADEGTDAENARLARYELRDEEARRAYRELLFTTPGIDAHLNGVIMSVETFAEKTEDGTSFAELLRTKNILPGVVLDPFADDDALHTALAANAALGATFAAFIADAPAPDGPVSDVLEKNTSALAHAATRALASGLVPLIALDTSPAGLHSAEKAEDEMLEALSLLADALTKAGVDPAHVIVGTSMALSGADVAAPADAREIAERTARAVTTALPKEIGGVVFLSDSQTAEEATENLNALARLEPLPWPIAFCFLRALQDPVLETWQGNTEKFADAQAVFENRLSLLSSADAAGYSPVEENDSF